MNLDRVLEPEVMDSEEEARDYDEMDHSEVNRRFVDDLLAVEPEPGDLLDLGTGTALVAVELCRRSETTRVMAIDLSISMLDIARYNIEVAGLIEQISLAHIDAKELPYEEELFDGVLSNSIIHHIPDPIRVVREATRVTKPGGFLFFRDLMRPADEATVIQLVEEYAGNATERQKKLFGDSLRAALTVDEMRSLVREIGFPEDGVQATSDRHWTWIARTRTEE